MRSIRHTLIAFSLPLCSICLLGLLTSEVAAQSPLSQSLQNRLRERQGETKPAPTAQQSSRQSGAPTVAPKEAPASDPVKTETPTADSESSETTSSQDAEGETIESIVADSPQSFAEAMSLAIGMRDLGKFNELVSWKTIAAKATQSLSGKVIDEYKTTLLKEVDGTNSLGAKIISTVQNGGTYDFMELKKNNKTVVAVFRMILPGGRGVNYHEYILAKTKSNLVVAADIYVYLTGETLSKSIRRNLITALAESKSAQGVKLSESEQLFVKNISTVKELTTAVSSNKSTEARELLLKLPATMRKDKAVQSLMLTTYRNASSFNTVLDQVRKANPDDVFMEMLAIDAYAGQKKYEKAIESIDKISARVGGDPYLAILKGRMHLNLGQREEGEALIREAVELDDQLLSGYWNLISFALQDQDHGETLKLLKIIDERFKIKFRDLKEIPSYKNFIASSEYKEWIAYRQETAAPVTDDNQAPGTDSTDSAVKATDSIKTENQKKGVAAEKTGPVVRSADRGPALQTPQNAGGK